MTLDSFLKKYGISRETAFAWARYFEAPTICGKATRNTWAFLSEKCGEGEPANRKTIAAEYSITTYRVGQIIAGEKYENLMMFPPSVKNEIVKSFAKNK